MNELRKNFKSFEEGLKHYLYMMQCQEKDCGNCAPPTEEELKNLKERFKKFWEMEDFEMPKNCWGWY